jgi:aminoglycoside phosphotransferase (APT) family kinase protein
MTVSAAQAREQANVGTREVAAAFRFDEGALDTWLRSHVQDYAGPLQVRQFKGGQSNPTYQLTTPKKRYVLRRKPPGILLPSAHAIDREFRMISALYPTGFPVARPLALCTDEAVIGTWFYVMDMVEGRNLWDPTLPQYLPSERWALFRAKISTLADLHNTRYLDLGLESYGKPGNYMARQVDRWTRQYRASEGNPIDEVERLIDWLAATVPAQDCTSIVHGDYRLDNLIYHSTNAEVAAVLDWELSTIGDPLADFTYLLMNWIDGPLAQIADLSAHGIPSLEEAIDYYCSLTGRPGLENLYWFFAYNSFRVVGIIQGILRRAHDGIANHPDAAALAPQVDRYAKIGWSCARRAGAS